MASTALSVSLLDAVQGIAPLIRAHAAQSEQNRRLADATVEAMKKAGLFRMCKPRAFGGLEVDAITAIRVIEQVARIDMSAGWNLFLSSTALPFANFLPERGVEDFLG